jgi:hypothetical protein
MSAHALSVVADLDAGSGRGSWALDRHAVARRLTDLVQRPSLISQGRLNLCGPALVFKVWLERDPVACVTFARALFEEGTAQIGSLSVRPSPGLLAHAYRPTAGRPTNCPSADWMLMAALRDATNRAWPYRWEGGPREAIAAMTLPGALRRWLTATGLYSSVRDETNLVWARGLAHARTLAPAPECDLFLLVASELFDRPRSLPARLGKYAVSLLPNHWIALRSRVIEPDADLVAFTFWSWGADQPPVVLPRTRFRRCYYGAVTADAAAR